MSNTKEVKKGAFKGVKNEIWVSCQAALPTDKSKDNIEQFRIKFSKLKESDYKAMLERVRDEDNPSDMASELSKLITDWEVQWDDGSAADFTKENLEAIWEEGPYAAGIIEGFMQLQMGKKNYKRLYQKN